MLRALEASHPRLRGLEDLVRLAWPVVLARLGIMVMGLTDAIVVGRYAAQELAFHSIAWAPTSIVLTTAVGLLLGVQVMAARLTGEGRHGEVGAVLRRGLVYSLQIGLASMLALILAGPWALMRAGLEPGLGEGAVWPLIIFSLSLPAYLVSVVATFFLEALGRPKPGMIAMWVANLVNLGLNLWLVPGHGVPIDGAVGAAWATFGARLTLAVFLIVFILRLPEARHWNLWGRQNHDRATAREQKRVGYGAGASYFIEVGAFAAMSFVAGWLGGLEVAAWTIVLNVAAMVFMVPMGVGGATAVLVARAHGAGSRADVLQAGGLGFGLTVVLTGVIGLVVWLAAGAIARVYATDEALIALIVPALVLSCLFFVADGLQVVAAQAVRAAGDVWWPTIMHIISYSLIMLPLGYVFAHPLGLGVDGIVWSVIVASVVSASLLCGRFLRVGRRV